MSVAEVQQEIYELQREAEWQKTGRAARLRELKARAAEAEEGRKAEVQLVDADLARVTPDYTAALDSAIAEYERFVAAMERLYEVSAQREAVLRRARNLDVEIAPEVVAEGFYERCRGDYKLDTFHRLRGVAVMNSGWPK